MSLLDASPVGASSGLEVISGWRLTLSVQRPTLGFRVTFNSPAFNSSTGPSSLFLMPGLFLFSIVRLRPCSALPTFSLARTEACSFRGSWSRDPLRWGTLSLGHPLSRVPSLGHSLSSRRRQIFLQAVATSFSKHPPVTYPPWCVPRGVSPCRVLCQVPCRVLCLACFTSQSARILPTAWSFWLHGPSDCTILLAAWA